MFGFLKVDRERLTDEAIESYRSHYCAACHATAAVGGGPSAALLTTYEQTFLLLFAQGLEEGRSTVLPQQRPCTALPLHSVFVETPSGPVRRFVGALGLAVVAAKMSDDAEDEGRWSSRAGLHFMGARLRRAMGALEEVGFPVAVIADLPQRQSTLERAATVTLDDLCEPTAAMLSEVFGFLGRLTENATAVPSLRRFGDLLGRTIYLWDAVQDAPQDIRRGRANALARIYGPDWDRTAVRGILLQHLADLDSLLERTLPPGTRRSLVENLLQRLADQIYAASPELPVPPLLRRWRYSSTPPERLSPGLLASRRLQAQRGDCLGDFIGSLLCGSRGQMDGLCCVIFPERWRGPILVIFFLALFVVGIFASVRQGNQSPPVPSASATVQASPSAHPSPAISESPSPSSASNPPASTSESKGSASKTGAPSPAASGSSDSHE